MTDLFCLRTPPHVGTRFCDAGREVLRLREQPLLHFSATHIVDVFFIYFFVYAFMLLSHR